MASVALSLHLSSWGATLAAAAEPHQHQHQHQRKKAGRCFCGGRGASFGLTNLGSMPAPVAGCSQKRMLEMSKLQHVPRARKASWTSNDVDFDDDDSDELDAPIKDMQKWFKQKPSGFGKEKIYDVLLEEKLFHEIERDKLAQAAAKQRMKDKGRTKENKIGPPPEGIKVWVGNLPKKRNVERDLRKILKNVQGLLHIEPIEVGDEKTRHPLCKGFAFLTFANEDDAKSFISSWEGKVGIFGKVERQLTFQFVGDKSSADFKPVRKLSSVLPSQSQLKVRENTTKALRDALEAAFQSKKPNVGFELQKTPSSADAVVVAEVLDESGLVDLQMEANPDEDLEIEKDDGILAINDTGRLASPLAGQLIEDLTEFEDDDLRSTRRESEFPDGVLGLAEIDSNASFGVGDVEAAEISPDNITFLENAPSKNIAANQQRMSGADESYDLSLDAFFTAEALTIESQGPTSSESSVSHSSDHDLEELMVEVNDSQEVDPPSELLSSSLLSLRPYETVLNDAEGGQTWSVPVSEATEIVDEKDKRIHELELMVQELQNQLQNQALSLQVSLDKSKATVGKRVAPKPQPAGRKPSASKLSRNPRATESNPSKTKNLQPSGLKKKERQIFLSAATKYAIP